VTCDLKTKGRPNMLLGDGGVIKYVDCFFLFLILHLEVSLASSLSPQFGKFVTPPLLVGL